MHLLRQPRFALLVAGAALNEVGSWASIIAFWGYAAYRFHSGPDQIALVSILWVAPGAVFGLLSGVPIDRFGPRAVLLAANAWGAVTAAAMAWSSSYGQLAALVFCSGLVGAFGRPAGSALTPRLVEDRDLLAANSMMSMTTSVAIVAGPLVASVTISFWSIKGAFLIDAVTFVIGALSLLPIRPRPLETHLDHQHASDFLAGARVVWRTRNLRRALTMATVVFVTWGASMVMEPLYVRDILHRSSATFGWLQSIFGVGLIVASLILPRLGERVVRLRAQAALLLVSAGGVAMYLASGNLAVACIGIALWGLATGAYLPPFYTLMQRGSPEGTHGRVMAVASTMNNISQICAVPIAGAAVSLVGIRLTALIEVAALIGFGALGRSWDPAARPPPTGSRDPGGGRDRVGLEEPARSQGPADPSASSNAAATAG